MLSSSPAKIHEPLAVGVSPRPTGRQNCETRGSECPQSRSGRNAAAHNRRRDAHGLRSPFGAATRRLKVTAESVHGERERLQRRHLDAPPRLLRCCPPLKLTT
jgi:hypothetical protein